MSFIFQLIGIMPDFPCSFEPQGVIPTAFRYWTAKIGLGEDGGFVHKRGGTNNGTS